jgi:carbon monoxide dehydrogenase subunit G
MTEQTRHADAPPLAVWNVLADFDRIVDWAPDVSHSSWMTEQTEGVGAARRVQVGSMTLVETATVWDEEDTLAYTIDGLPPIVSGVVTRWHLEPDASGTKVSVSSDVTPGPRPPMRIAAKAVERRMAAANAKMLDGLVAAAERERAS